MPIKVAFLVDYPHYRGGINYLLNLLTALRTVKTPEISAYVFVGTTLDANIKRSLAASAIVIESKFFDRRGLFWLLYKVLHRGFGVLTPINRLMKRSGIDVVSHSFIYGKGLPYKTINWLPDFQFTEMPQTFPKSDRMRRNILYRKMISRSDMLIVASDDALSHFKKYSNVGLEKVRILRFTVPVEPKVYEMRRESSISDVAQKYGIKGRYFYCPNQFWIHKNHMLLLAACKMLHAKGIDIQIVFSGSESDFRHPRHMHQIRQYISKNGIAACVTFLGLIPYDDVLYLMRNSVSIINPSAFEGWSTTVEEAKSLGKNIILSNIVVHLEQSPPGAAYFDVTSQDDLARVLGEKWNSKTDGPDFDLEGVAKLSAVRRTAEYGNMYAQCILECIG